MGAIGKVIKTAAGDKPSSDKGGKAKDFMHGLKTWITSPGGIATVLLFVAAMWYIHSRTEKKAGKAAA